MRLPIGKLLPAAFVSYVAYEIYQLYAFCQPPLAKEGAEGAATWDLQAAGQLDLLVFLALTESPPPSAALTAGQEGASRHHVLIGTFEGLRPGESATRADVRADALDLPQAFYSNDTIFLHALAVRHGARPSAWLRHEVVRISRYVVQPDRRVHKRYLLGAPPAAYVEPADAAEAALGSLPVTSLPKVVEVGFVTEHRTLLAQGLREKGLGGFVSGTEVRLPLYVNTLVSPRDEYAPLLPGGRPPGLELRLRSVGLAYWTMQLQIGQAFDEAEQTMGLNEYDVDSFKQMIGGSSPYKILLVYAVSILHLVFEYLAFASDISFWRSKTSFEGLSSSSVTMQACMNVIMFLYVKEQRQTKFVMYFIAFRFCIQLWKLRKLTTLERCSGWPYVRWVNRAGESGGLEELQDVHEAERRCMRGLMLVLLPVILAFCAYRLVHQRFRSWYSWIVLSLAVCAQMGGFVVMTPQVFMNYRLKSVEHLPWKALTYQAINTFIDDIFTLCIRMPEIQKYSVFRDDIIFIICCTQRWLYRKPAGPVGDEADAPEADKVKDE